MKKLVVAIFAVVYLVTSTGATIHFHYCMGELADWGLKHDASKKCCNCGLEKVNGNDGGFCTVEKKFLKNESAQKATSSAFKRLQIPAVPVASIFSNLIVVNFPSVPEEIPVSHAPPAQTKGAAVYILNCVFLI